jgi:hypothetical protein
VAKPPTVTLSNQIPNFPTSSANYFANKSIIREANGNERIERSAHVIGAVDELISTIKYIEETGEFRKISKTFQEKLETKGDALNKKTEGFFHCTSQFTTCNLS